MMRQQEADTLTDPDKLGIILAPFGTLSSAAYATYEAISQAYEKEFINHPIRLAFTSRLMRKKLAEREGFYVPGLLGALQDMQDLDCQRVVIQSLQIVPGQEFHQIAELVRSLKPIYGSGVPRLGLGLSLLSDLSECKAVSSLLAAIVRRAGLEIASGEERHEPKEAVLLAGHGTGHPSDALYSLLADILKKEHRNVFLAGIEGSTGLEQMLPDLKESGAERVLLMPFLLVAGGHAEKDLFGPGPRSWKSILEREGYSVLCYNRGLGESPEVLSIFMGHTRSALEKMKKT